MKEFRDIQSNEESNYVIKYLIGCLELLPPSNATDLWPLIVSMVQNDNKMYRYVLQDLDKPVFTSETYTIMFNLFGEKELDSFETAILLRIAFLYGDSKNVKSIHENLSSDSDFRSTIFTITSSYAITKFLESRDSNSLFYIADTLADLGFHREAFTASQEFQRNSIDSDRNETVVENHQQLSPPNNNPEIIFPGLPSWYSLEIDQEKYFDLSDPIDYECRKFIDTNRKGCLEIISATRISDNSEFPSPQVWLSYLKRLNSQRIIALLECGELHNNAGVFAIYEIPDGYVPLNELFENNKFLNNELEQVKLAHKICEVLRQTIYSTFMFQNLSPCNVLVSLEYEIKFLNIGSSLGVPKYVNGINRGTSIRENFGSGTFSLFLGRALLQLAYNNSDFQREIDSKFNTPETILEQLTIDNFLPHTLNILTRMTNKKDDYRYSSIEPLEEDLGHVVRLLGFLASTSGVSQDQKEELILADFVTFRMAVILRDPNVENAPVFKRVSMILERISRSLKQYNPHGIQSLLPEPAWIRYRNKLPSWINWTRLIPEARCYWALAINWSELIKKVNQNYPAFCFTEAFSQLLLAKAVYVEAEATLQGLLTNSSGQDLALETKYNNQIYMHLESKSDAELHELNFAFGSDPAKDTSRNVFGHETLQQISKVLLLAEKDDSQHFSEKWSDLISLIGMIPLICLESEFRTCQNEMSFKSVYPIVKLPPRRSLKVNRWHFITYPSDIQSKIQNLTTSKSETSEQKDLDWYEISKTLISQLRLANPGKRYRVTLKDYRAIASPREGRIERRRWLLFKKMYHFTEFGSYTSGNLTIRKGKVVLADFLDSKDKPIVASVFAAPDPFGWLKYFESSYFASVKHHIVRIKWALLLPIILWCIYMLSQQFEQFDEYNKYIQDVPFIGKILYLIFFPIVWSVMEAKGDIIFAALAKIYGQLLSKKNS